MTAIGVKSEQGGCRKNRYADIAMNADTSHPRHRWTTSSREQMVGRMFTRIHKVYASRAMLPRQQKRTANVSEFNAKQFRLKHKTAIIPCLLSGHDVANCNWPQSDYDNQRKADAGNGFEHWLRPSSRSQLRNVYRHVVSTKDLVKFNDFAINPTV